MSIVRQVSTSALLTTTEVAGILRVSAKTVTRWADSGRLTFAQKLPGERGAYLFDPEVVNHLAVERRAELLAAAPEVAQ